MSFELIERMNKVLPPKARAVIFHWGHLHLMDLDEGQKLTMQHVPDYSKVIQHYANVGHSCTILVDGKPGLAFGTINPWPNLWELWLIADQPTAKSNPVGLTKYARRAVEVVEDIVKPVRLQLVVRRDNFSACKWARAIGFEEEATVRKYTPDGRDCVFFVRIR